MKKKKKKRKENLKKRKYEKISHAHNSSDETMECY